MQSIPTRNNAGFTLVEVVISTAILVMTMGALLYAFLAATQSATFAQYNTLSIQEARYSLERAITNYSSVTSYAATAVSTNSALSRMGGTRSCNVITTNGYKQITLVISWKNPTGSLAASNVLQTILCDPN